jgi:hypothetical protein
MRPHNLNAVQKTLGRFGKIPPVIGGIFVVSGTIAGAENFNYNLNQHASNVRNDGDVTGDAVIVSGD